MKIEQANYKTKASNFIFSLPQEKKVAGYTKLQLEEFMRDGIAGREHYNPKFQYGRLEQWAKSIGKQELVPNANWYKNEEECSEGSTRGHDGESNPTVRCKKVQYLSLYDYLKYIFA